ncbi:hypothetical protein D3C72_1339460 [compost metagenome]
MQCALQIGEADVFIDNQPFHLMEHRGVRLVVVITINAARRNNADWRLLVLHGADLHAGSLGAQQARGVEPEGIVIGTRRVVTRNVQRVEVMIVVFNLRPGLYGETQFAEEGFDTVDGAGHWMQPTVFHTTARQGNVDGFCRQTLIQRSRFQRIFTRVQRILHCLFCLVDYRACCRAIFCRHVTQRLHLQGKMAFLA